MDVIIVDNYVSETITVMDTAASVVVEVLAGQQGVPGVQNVYVGDTEPEAPFENLIWIDTNG